LCLAYIADINGYHELKSARWFTRGWCLQELIAPMNMMFFNKLWHSIGSKYQLRHLISEACGIDEQSLFSADLSSLPAAYKMSWAANRHTTRAEDIAYCLLGIFDINMPLLYGEGEKAFTRLQEEILKVTEDHTILAWERSNSPSLPANLKNQFLGVFARHPSDFYKSTDIERSRPTEDEPLAITSRGIRIRLQTWRATPYFCFGVLSCHRGSNPNKRISIGLKLAGTGSGVFARAFPHYTTEADLTEETVPVQTIYLLKWDKFRESDMEELGQCWLRTVEKTQNQFTLMHATPDYDWNATQRMMAVRHSTAPTRCAFAYLPQIGGDGFAVLVSLDPSDQRAAMEIVPLKVGNLDEIKKTLSQLLENHTFCYRNVWLNDYEDLIGYHCLKKYYNRGGGYLDIHGYIGILKVRGKKSFVIDILPSSERLLDDVRYF
jgi:hypothetical protein